MTKFFILLFAFIPLFLFSQQVDFIDFKKGEANITIDPLKKEVSGTITYTFDVLKNTDSIFIDAQKMEFSSVKLNNKKVKFNNTNSKLWIIKKLKPNTQHQLSFHFTASPEKAMYFIGWEYENAKKQVWTQGQGKYTSNWLPSFDDMNEKVEFDLNITFDKKYEVIANGKLINSYETDSLKTWHYDMQQPMSSYLVGLVIGKYNKKTEYSKSGIPIEMYYYPEDSLRVEPTYRYTKKIFDFFEDEIGIPYPWQNYKQIPVKNFLYAGMENTTATIFSDTYMIDSISFIDKNYVNVNAHEMAHQWFGNLITAQNGTHHWLQEGFATYYALLAENEIFGDDYFHWKLYQSAKQLVNLSEKEKGESLLNPNASSLTFYEKGAWALVKLKERVGNDVFKSSIKQYLNTYQYENVTTNEFIKIVEQEYGKDLNEYVDIWLKNEKILNAEIESYFANYFSEDSFLLKIAEIDFDVFRVNIDSLMASNVFYPAKQKVFEAIQINSFNESDYVINAYKKGFKTNDIKTRQSISEVLNPIPLELKKDFESLLEDASYITIENALYKLWLNFPDERTTYLNKTKNIIGFNDKNVRMLWLALALATSNYDNNNTPFYFNELSAYTSPINHIEIRQNAFIYLHQMMAFTDQNLKDLVNACMHYSWRFAKFSREILDSLIKDDDYRKRFVDLIGELNDDEAKYVLKKIENL